MIKVFIFLGLALSIVKANGWITIPNFAIVFCWGASITSVLIYAYIGSIKKRVVDKLAEGLKTSERCPICGRSLPEQPKEEVEGCLI